MGSKTSKEEKPAQQEGTEDEKADECSESKEDHVTVDLTKNVKWLKRMEAYFDTVDLNKNGYITVEEILKWADNVRDICDVTPEEAENLQKNIKEFYGAAGLVADKQVTKEEFVEGVNRLGQAELERKRLGEETLHENLLNAFYKAMDINNDGEVSLNEVKTMVKACNMQEAVAEEWFNMADRNENGVVETQELTKAGFGYWFRPENESED